MADEPQALRNVNWNEVFSFTQIFKSFKMAIHPSKLLLCLAGLVVMFATGVVLDKIWSIGGGYVMPDEIIGHATRPSEQFDRAKERWEDYERRRNAAAQLVQKADGQFKDLSDFISDLQKAGNSSFLVSAFTKKRDDRRKANAKDLKVRTPGELLKDDGDSDFDLLGKAERAFANEAAVIDSFLDGSYDDAKGAIGKDSVISADKKRKAKEIELLEEHYSAAWRQLSELKLKRRMEAKQLRGEKISEAFLAYEWYCIRSAVAAVCYGNITTGLKGYQNCMEGRGPQPVAEGDPFAGAMRAEPGDNPRGFLFYSLLAYRGVVWLIAEHWVYAAIYLFVALCTCAVFGGALHRIAALHFARDEKISLISALKFSISKFFSFLSAPLIPIGIIVLLGLLIAVGGLLLNVPWLGEIVVGVLFFLALLLGLAIAFLVVGYAGGVGLMYPTIAAEGSDSFDGISRSFSYVFAKPWRAGLYALVALIYGVVTYLFVRLFVFIALSATHCFVKWFVWASGDEVHQAADKVDVLWTAPTFGSLFGRFSWDAMSTMQSLGAFLIGIWVFLLAALVVSYLLSYAASATTVIYFLLRRQVDATDLDDVYLEEIDEEPVVSPEEAREAEEAAVEEEAVAEEAVAEEAEAEAEPEADEGDGEKPSE